MKRFPHAALNDKIDESGWIVTGVPGLAMYTVGLMDLHGHPEVAIHGLSPHQAYHVLYSVKTFIENGGELTAGRDHKGILETAQNPEIEVRSITVDPSNFEDWFGQAYAYHREDLEMVQILWPDTEWKFPGDDGYDMGRFRQLAFDHRQPGYEHEAAEFSDMAGHTCSCCGEGCESEECDCQGEQET